MKKKRRKWVCCIQYTVMFISILALTGFDMGGEYTNDDACGNPHLSAADDDVHGFINVMKAFGHTRKFVWGNTLFWPEDLVDCSVTGGIDCNWGDKVTAMYLHSHGGSTPEAFRITTGVFHEIDGINTCRSYTYRNNKQWWKLGDKNLRYLFMVSCHSLELDHLAHWDGVAKGIHIITGGDGDLFSRSSRGSTFALLMNMPIFKQTIKSAWFSVRGSNETVVVMAYGSSRSDAINRRDREKLGWSTARVSPVTWRAWAWIN